MSEIRRNIFLEDGRRAERRIVEMSSENCESEIVNELWEEKPLPKYLTQRVIEKRRPMVVERETQIMDEDGKTVVETRRESLEPDYKLQLREVTKTVEPEQPTSLAAKKSCDCEEAVQPLRDEIAALREEIANGNKKSMRASNRVSAQSLLGEKLEDDEKKLNLWDVLGVAVILTQIGAVAWFLIYF